MKVAYVIYNERPSSGLLRTQVISLLKEIKSQAPEIDLTMISFWQPWIAFKYRKQLHILEKDLISHGIKWEDCPWAIIPSRYFLYNKYLFPILHLWGRLLFRRMFINKHYNIIHNRAYFASLISSENKAIFKIRCIFDMRSLWPKEHVTIGVWTIHDAIYQMWKRLERRIITNSDAIIGVSYPMIEEIKQIVPSAKAELIPICVNTEEFYFNIRAREEIRKDYNLNGRTVIAYQGSLGLLNRNIYIVVQYLSFLKDLIPNVFFFILSSAKCNEVSDIMERGGILSSQFIATESLSSGIHRWLSAADFGIHVMSFGPDSKTRLGVKVVEYLSCGLPIIVNSNVGAAAELVEKYQLGLVINLNEKENVIEGINRALSQSFELRERCRQIALNLFSEKSCASRYIRLYQSLAS